jgi:hypothetical protein
VLCQELPARTARLAYTEGTVSIQLTSDAQWDAVAVNTPLTTGNSIFAEPGARAEVRVSATAIRLSEGSELELRRLDDDRFEANVASGSASVRVRLTQRGERYVFTTPQASFVLDGDGTYRIDYDPVVDESRLTVASGSAHIEGGPGRNVVVSSGRSLRLAGGTEPSYELERAPDEDEFDHWARSRDAGWSDAATRRYVSPYMTGYEDLDANGQWSSDPEYGPVWTPSRVDPTWSPYSDGRWANVQPWGWTWIDNAPWGYAPFHYGRWVYVRNRWAWCPGRRVDRPIYAPALVGWTGTGSPVAGPGASGWYPLAPWERFQPWYRATPTHVDRVNAIVRDRQPPREWTGPADGWRNWNRDHATHTVNRETFPPHPASPPAQSSRTPPNAEALRHTRESSQHRQQQQPQHQQQQQQQKAPPPQQAKPPAQPARPVEKEKDKDKDKEK